MRRLLSICLLAACISCVGTRNLEERKSVSLIERHEGNDSIFVDTIIQVAHEEANAKLSAPTLTFFSYTGECAELLKFNGQFTFMYIESGWRFLGGRAYRALVVIDVAEKALEIEVDDVSEHYLSSISLDITGDEVVNAARLAQGALLSEGKCERIVVLSKTNTEGPWGIRCGKPDEVFLECMEIDLSSGAITIK